MSMKRKMLGVLCGLCVAVCGGIMASCGFLDVRDGPGMVKEEGLGKEAEAAQQKGPWEEPYKKFLQKYKKLAAKGSWYEEDTRIAAAAREKGIKGTGYALYDLDGDGTPEFFIGDLSTSYWWHAYTFINGKVFSLIVEDSGMPFYVTADNLLYFSSDNNTDGYEGWARKNRGEIRMDNLLDYVAGVSFNRDTGAASIYRGKKDKDGTPVWENTTLKAVSDGIVHGNDGLPRRDRKKLDVKPLSQLP